MTQPPVVIIGAGFAGLTAAVRLAGAGRRVLVLEARPRLGGRATAFEDRATGALVDNGQHVMFGCYRETLDLLRTVGAEEHVRIQQALDVPFIDARGRLTRLRCPDLPPPLHLFGGLLGWDALRWRDRWAAVRVWRAVKRVQGSGFRVQGEGAEAGQRVQGFRLRAKRFGGPAVASAKAGRVQEEGAEAARALSVRDWLIALRQTRRLREFLWEPLAVAALNEPADVAPAEAFAQVLALMFTGPAQHAAIVMPAAPLDRMYAEPARAFIEAHGGTVRTGALAKVLASDAGVSAVRVGEEVLPCRSVISAVPWNSFGNLFDSLPPALAETARAAAGLTSRPIVTANLWYDRMVTDDSFVGLPGCTIQWVFEKGRHTSHLSCIVSGAIELVERSNEEILEVAASDIRERLPRARGAALVRSTVVRERHATFSAGPGTLRPETLTKVPGFYLAGDWIDTGLPGTIEGAVRSGRLAAEASIMRGIW